MAKKARIDHKALFESFDVKNPNGLIAIVKPLLPHLTKKQWTTLSQKGVIYESLITIGKWIRNTQILYKEFKDITSYKDWANAAVLHVSLFQAKPRDYSRQYS